MYDHSCSRIHLTLTRVEHLSLQATKLTLVDGIRSNTNMASALCSYHVNAGSWKKLLFDLEQVDQLTAADVQAVAAATFQQDNLYTGYMLKE